MSTEFQLEWLTGDANVMDIWVVLYYSNPKWEQISLAVDFLFLVCIGQTFWSGVRATIFVGI